MKTLDRSDFSPVWQFSPCQLQYNFRQVDDLPFGIRKLSHSSACRFDKFEDVPVLRPMVLTGHNIVG